MSIVGRVLFSCVVFISYVFIFPMFVSSVNAISLSEPLYPVFHVIPYVLGVVLMIVPIISMSGGKDD